jgi:hypothetical protein
MALATKPPEELTFASLAELYDRFCALLIGKEFQCPRETRIIIIAHHFFHLVKLQKGAQAEFSIEVEEALIKAATDGLGGYTIDSDRARRLSWIPEILGEPDEILEPYKKKTADEVFLREYDKSGSAFRAVLLKREEGNLRLITCMPMRRRRVAKLRRESKRLWP